MERRLRFRMRAAALAILFSAGLPVAALGRKESPPSMEERLRSHVSVLASDEFQGRETGSPGVGMAEDYIARTFRTAGLSPMPGAGGYFLPFTLFRFVPDEEHTFVRFTGTGESWKAGDDFRPFPFSGKGSVDAEAVFAGFGITAPEYGYDDYRGLDVKGKVVVVFRHEPHENNPSGDFNGTVLTDHALFTRKAENAERHGAVGMLLVTDPLNHTGSEDLRLRPVLSLDASGEPEAEAGPDGNTRRRRIVSPSFLAFQVSGRLAEALLGSSGRSPGELQRNVDGGKRPAELTAPAVRIALSYGGLRNGGTVEARNVAAFLPGRDPKLKDEWIIVSAHHDHLGFFPGTGDTVYNGADDDASGVSAVLALAESFAGGRVKPARSILFVTFSGEEEGLFGSRALVRSGLLGTGKPAGRAVFDINLDMIGRNPDRPVDVFGDGLTPGLREIVEEENRKTGLSLLFHGKDFEPDSDHATFFRAGIPFMFFFTGLHEDYHGLDDEADRLSYGRMASITNLSEAVIRRLANGPIGLPASPGVAMSEAGER